jgi:PAS domain S-box-containing protein
MRNFIKAIIFGGFLALSVCARGQNPTIQSGCEVDYPPFCIVHEDGRADGFSVELMRAALQKMGYDVTFRTGPWAEVRTWLEEGEIDALPLVGRTPEREDLFDFTVPYLTMHGAIVVRDDTRDVYTLADLRGRRVAVMEGDNAEEFLRREPRDFKIVTTPTFSDALREVSAGRCDAVVMQRLVGLRLLEESGLNNLRMIDQPLRDFRQDWCFAVQEGDRETLALLNEGLALVVADGTLRRLRSKWFAYLRLPQDRTIRFGGDHNYPPFEFLDEEGKPAGFNVDLLRAVARESGLDVEVQLFAWPRVMSDLAAGEIDAVEGMFYSPARDRTFDFSQGYIVNHYVAVGRADSGDLPASVDDLKGKSIAIQKSDIAHDFLMEKKVDAHIVALNSQEEALHELAEGKHDFVLAARQTALYCIEKRGWSHLRVGREPLLSPEYCFAVPEGREALLATLSEGLQAVKQSGEYHEIYEKWLGVYDERIPFQRVFKYIAWIALPLAGIALLAFLWSWSLRKEVRNRTAALREASHRRDILIEQSRDGIVILDGEGRVCETNEKFCEMLGYTRDEILAMGAWDWDARFAKERVQEMVQTVDRSGDHFVTRHRRKDGSVIDVEVSTNAVVWGAEKRVFCVCRDITERKRMERETEASRRLLNFAIEQIPIPVIIAEAPDVKLIHINQAAIDLLQKKPERVEDIELSEHREFWPTFYPDGTPYKVEDLPLTRAIQAGEVTRNKEIVVRGAEGDRWISASAAPLRDPDGKIIAGIVAFPDITDRYLMEVELGEQLEFMQTLMDTIPNPVFYKDREGRYLGCNKAFEEVTGLSSQDLVGESVYAAGPNDIATKYEDKDRELFENPGKQHYEWKLKDRDGNLRDVVFDKATFSRPGEPVAGLVGVVSDITERKRLEQLRIARDAAEEASHAKSEFLAMITHELRTPLNAIIGFSEALRDGVYGELSERQVRPVDNVLESGQLLHAMTNDILDLSRLESGRLDFVYTQLDIEELLRQATLAIRSKAEKQRQEVRLEIDPAVHHLSVKADAQRVKQAWVNLLLNACKFSPDEQPVVVRASVMEVSDVPLSIREVFSGAEMAHVYLHVAVEDRGQGIDPANLERVFDRFHQEDSSYARDYGGTGLGLTLARGLFAVHGGWVWAKSEGAGKGSTFHTILPATPRGDEV